MLLGKLANEAGRCGKNGGAFRSQQRAAAGDAVDVEAGHRVQTVKGAQIRVRVGGGALADEKMRFQPDGGKAVGVVNGHVRNGARLFPVLFVDPDDDHVVGVGIG